MSSKLGVSIIGRGTAAVLDIGWQVKQVCGPQAVSADAAPRARREGSTPFVEQSDKYEAILLCAI
jgi:hypothetical protein